MSLGKPALLALVTACVPAAACHAPVPAVGAAAAGSAAAPAALSIPPSRVLWIGRLSADRGCAPAELQLLVPFLEGLRISRPSSSLASTGYDQFVLSYPGMLSMPFVAWRCGENPWTAIFTSSLDALPVILQVRALLDGVEAKLECYGECSFRSLKAAGNYQDIARAVASAWDVHPGTTPLAARYDDFQFFVHRWIAAEDAASPLRMEWDAASLTARLREQPSRTLTYIYGLDPGGMRSRSTPTTMARFCPARSRARRSCPTSRGTWTGCSMTRRIFTSSGRRARTSSRSPSSAPCSGVG